MAFTHVHITLQHLGLSDEQAILFDRLASRVFGSDMPRISPADLAANIFGQQNLWGYGISGDLPIVLVRVSDAASLPLVRQLLNAQEYWRVKGLRADVVILNEQPGGLPRRDAAPADEPACRSRRGAGWLGKPGGIFLLRGDGMADVDRRLLGAVARVVLPGRPRRADARSWSARRRGCTTSTTCRRPPCSPRRSRRPCRCRCRRS